MAEMTPQKDTPRPGRLWKIVLVISLALNLAVVGLVVGAATKGRFGDGPPRSFDLGAGPISRALDPGERQAILRELRAQRALRDVNPRETAAALRAALRAEPFDAAALTTLLDARAERTGRLQKQLQDALVTTIAGMSPERRAAFADRLEEELSRPRRPKAPARSGG